MTEPGWWRRDRPEDGRPQDRAPGDQQGHAGQEGQTSHAGQDGQAGRPGEGYRPEQGYTQPIPQYPTRPIGPVGPGGPGGPGSPGGPGGRPGGFGPLQGLAPGQDVGPLPSAVRRRRRGRGWAALLVVLVCFGLLAVAADRGAVMLAENALGRGVQTEQRLDRPARVSIAGFPFLTQALAGRYRQIDLAADGVPTGNGLVADQVTVRLADVTASASDLVAGRVDRLRAGRVTVRARVGYDAVDAVVAEQLRNDILVVRFADGGDNRLEVTGTIRTLVGELQLKGLVRASLVERGIRLQLVPRSVQGLPGAVDGLLADLLDLTLATPDQVSGIRPTRLEVGPDGITLTGAGTDVPLGDLAR